MGLFDFFKKKDKNPDWVSQMPIELAKLFLVEIKSNPQACSFDEIPQGIGKFGLEASNPIPVYGVASNNIYFTRLALKDNSGIRWRRVGSMKVSNIDKLIDEYEIFNLNGDTICFLYLSPYHWKISDKCPEGFKFT
jgi:hypothetical protein